MPRYACQDFDPDCAPPPEVPLEVYDRHGSHIDRWVEFFDTDTGAVVSQDRLSPDGVYGNVATGDLCRVYEVFPAPLTYRNPVKDGLPPRPAVRLEYCVPTRSRPFKLPGGGEILVRVTE